MISETEWLAAEELGQEKRDSGLYAVDARYDASSQTMRIAMKKGFIISFAKERSQMMATATDEQLSEVQVQGGGRYIIFTKLDDGFTVDGVLEGRFGSESWEQSWVEKHLEPVAA
jgi:hypothetical protein